MQYPSPGPGDSSQYTVSGLPFAVSGSGAATIQFPYLTQWIWVHSSAGTTNIGFTQNGLNNSGNFFSVPSTLAMPVLPLRVKTIYVSGTQWEIVAGLTMVEPRMWPTLTASSAPGAAGQWTNLESFGYSGIG